MDHSDIVGAKPRKERVIATRDLFSVGDIDGAKPKKPISRSKVHNETYEDVSNNPKF